MESLGLRGPDDEGLSDEEALRLIVGPLDPVRGRPVPPPKYTAAELIAMAERREVPLNCGWPSPVVGRASVPRRGNAPLLTAGQRWRARDRDNQR